jgi:hypothetical protein
MKKLSSIEALTFAGIIGVSAFAIADCQTVNITDEEGNITGTDIVCTETVDKPITTTRSLKSINSRIKWLKADIESAKEERTRDYDRSTERITKNDAEKALLIQQRDIMKAAGANITEEDEIASGDEIE